LNTNTAKSTEATKTPHVAIAAIHHTAVIVTDLARAKHFYGVVLGLQEISRPGFPFGGAWYRVGDSQELHLIVYPQAKAVRGTTRIDPRDGHFAVRVASYADTLASLRMHGITCLEAPDNLTPWAQIYVTDPDGNVIELNADRSTIAEPQP
jgi:catechol 2,3-dioxygenase-like lactoylglutathione lyase family enzyme